MRFCIVASSFFNLIFVDVEFFFTSPAVMNPILLLKLNIYIFVAVTMLA